MTQQEIHEVEQGIRPPESVKMTLEEFLAHDVEGYEYVNGELVPMAPPSREHGEISVNVIRYLDAHVYQNKLGRRIESMTQQEIHEVEQGIRPPESVKMTLEEFLAHKEI